jgi:uncharacterized protein YcbX
VVRSTVVAIVRYPLKSARGERLGEADLDQAGVRGDRTWACVDAMDGNLGSVKHPRRWGGLLQVRAALGTDGRTVEVHVAGRSHAAGSAAADRALSTHLGHPVRLTHRPPPNPRLHRRMPDQAGLIPEWMADVGAGEETVTVVTGVGRVGRFVDFAAVHLLTTGALERLGRRLGTEAVAATRFRPNLVVDAPADPVPGTELRVGDAVLRVVLPTPRCVVPGLAHDDLSTDPRLLSAIARHYRVPVPGRGRAACFGTYADVVRPGHVRIGQQVEIETTHERG